MEKRFRLIIRETLWFVVEVKAGRNCGMSRKFKERRVGVSTRVEGHDTGERGVIRSVKKTTKERRRGIWEFQDEMEEMARF